MSSPSELEAAKGQPIVDKVEVGEKVQVVVANPRGAIPKKATSAPSPAKMRAWTAFIKAFASNIGAIIMAVGLVIVLAIAVCNERKEAYAPICALLGTLVGTWLKGKASEE